MVTLSWELDVAALSDIENCSNVAYFVRSRSFLTYRDYSRRILEDITQETSIEEGILSFITTELHRDRYYIFDVSTQFTDSAQTRGGSRVTTPLYYFGDQGMGYTTIYYCAD